MGIFRICFGCGWGGLQRGHCETRPADTRDALYGRAQKDALAKSPDDAGIGCARGISSGAAARSHAPPPSTLTAACAREVSARNMPPCHFEQIRNEIPGRFRKPLARDLRSSLP